MKRKVLASLVALTGSLLLISQGNALQVNRIDGKSLPYVVSLEKYSKDRTVIVPVSLEMIFDSEELKSPYEIDLRLDNGFFLAGIYRLVDVQENIYAETKIDKASSELIFIVGDESKNISEGKVLNLVYGDNGKVMTLLQGKAVDCSNLPLWNLQVDIYDGAGNKYSKRFILASAVNQLKIKAGNASVNLSSDLQGFSNGSEIEITPLIVEKKSGFDVEIDSAINFTFNLVSLYPESGIKIEGCNSTDNQNFSCSYTLNAVGEENEIKVKVVSNGIIFPTIWSLGNILAGENMICNMPVNSQIGIWKGGVEYLIPFVRVDNENGVATTIVVTNRGSKPVVVYGAIYNDDRPLIVPQTKLIEVPAKDTVRIYYSDLENAFDGSDLLKKGTAMKLLISAEGEGDNVDPYVTVYVVYDYAGKTRYVPAEKIR